MRRSLVLLGFAVFLAGNPAWQTAAAACEGAEVIFEDKFADDAGGWPLRETIEVKDGLFIFKLPPDDMQSNLNVTFTVKDADICSETVWPNGEQPMLNNGKFWIARKQDGKWLGTIAANVDSAAINKEPGSANTLRVKATGNNVTFFINGTKVRELRGQAPKGDWRFGLSGDNFDKEKDARVVFKTVKVTD
jgi:hypothetical protein